MKLNTIKIGFTGTREGMNDIQKTKTLDILNKYVNYIIEIHHGDCIGADTDFHNICEDFRKKTNVNLTIVIHPPNNKGARAFNKADILLEEKQYLDRNTDIVMMSDIIIGCPHNVNDEILRSGTWSTIRKARKMKKILHVF